MGNYVYTIMLRLDFGDEQVAQNGAGPLLETDRKYSEKGLCYNSF